MGGLFLDQGLDAVTRWLDLLFQPYARAAYLIVRQQHGLPALPTPSSSPRSSPAPIRTEPSGMLTPTTTVGHLALFNQHLQKLNRDFEWKYSEGGAPGLSGEESTNLSIPSGEMVHGNKTTPVWFVEIIVEGELFGRGRGNTKKAARNEAAKEGLQKLKVFVW